jgi:hypothetical protein
MYSKLFNFVIWISLRAKFSVKYQYTTNYHIIIFVYDVLNVNVILFSKINVEMTKIIHLYWRFEIILQQRKLKLSCLSSTSSERFWKWNYFVLKMANVWLFENDL